MTAPSGFDDSIMAYASTLNTIGIYLLEKNAYLQALATFRDALVEVAKNHVDLTQEEHGNAEETAEFPRWQINRMIENAKSSVQHLEPFPRPSSCSAKTCLTVSTRHLETADDIVLLLESAASRQHEDCLFAVESDVLDFADGTAKTYVDDFVCCVVLYNYGLAHKAYAHSLENVPRVYGDLEHNQAATQLLTFSELILEKLTSDGEDETRNISIF